MSPFHEEYSLIGRGTLKSTQNIIAINYREEAKVYEEKSWANNYSWAIW